MFYFLKSKKQKTKQPFWERKKLSQMTEEEWESLCDRCGKCCLIKIGVWRIRFTNIGCPLLNVKTGLCSNYSNRWDSVPECIKLTPKNLRKYAKYLPKTCAYLWILKKHRLPPWHYLVSGSHRSVHQMGISVKNRAEPFQQPIDLREHVISWSDL